MHAGLWVCVHVCNLVSRDFYILWMKWKKREDEQKNIKREISADRRNTLAHILCYMLLNVYTTRKVKLNQNNREEEKKKKKTNSEKKKK